MDLRIPFFPILLFLKELLLKLISLSYYIGGIHKFCVLIHYDSDLVIGGAWLEFAQAMTCQSGERFSPGNFTCMKYCCEKDPCLE